MILCCALTKPKPMGKSWPDKKECVESHAELWKTSTPNNQRDCWSLILAPRELW